MDPQSIDFTLWLMRVPGPLECVYITFQRVLPLPLTLGSSRTSRGLPALAGGGRQHRYKVPRVLPKHRGPYAVVISRGFFRCRRSAFAAPRGCHTSARLTRQRLAALRLCSIEGIMSVCCLLRRLRGNPSGEYMLHAWLVNQLVAEPRKVANMTAKVNKVPAAFRSST